jgi:transcriptional regulator with XRE-family HTH domain
MSRQKDIGLGKRIAWLRKNRGLEQKEAAEQIGILYGTYQLYEYGNHPSRKNIELILAFYKCSRAWLLTGEGVPYPDRPQDACPEFGDGDPSVAYISSAARILAEAAAEAGVELNDAQKTAILKIIEDELNRTEGKVKEIIRVLKKES